MSGFGDLNRVNTNVQSLDAQLSLNKINKNLSDNQLRLSTGLRINRAEDDSAGFSIATKLNSRVAGLEQALQNVGDAKSVLDIAEASFDTIIDNLIEMKSLSTQAANDTLGNDERQYIAQQIAELGSEINEIANQTVFQDLDLLNGRDGSHDGSLSLTFQTGERAQDTITTNIDAVNINQLFKGSESLPIVEISELEFEADTDANNITDIVITVGEDPDVTTETITGLDISISDTSSLGEIVSAINSENIEGLTAEVFTNAEGEEDIRFINTSGEDINISFNDTGGDEVLTGEVDGVGADSDVAPGQGLMDLSGWDSGDFRSFMADVDDAIGAMADRVNAIGVSQSSLSTRELTLSQAISSNTSAASRIMDADFAKEQSESIRLQILQQTATSALAQANMGPQSVLGFIG